MGTIKIFPIPYAGASVNVYYGWKKLLPKGYELYMNELAGRGRRFHEKFYLSIDEAAKEIADCIIRQLQSSDEYVIFGHSMGALLTYEVYYYLVQHEVQLPKHLFLSGRKPPQISLKEENVCKLDDESFMKYVKKFGGIPKEFINKEVREVFLPILRADFAMLDRYVYVPRNDKIHCNMSVLYGNRDVATSSSEMEKWTELSDRNVNFYEYDGEHFFINNLPEEIVNLIVKVTQI